MSSIEEATDLVKFAIKSLEDELTSSPDPKLIGVPRSQKEVFRQRLEKVLDFLQSGKLPEKTQRDLGLSRAVVDGWPFDSELSEHILKAERAFVEVEH